MTKKEFTDMEPRLLDVLNGRGGNYILPLLWMHGGNVSVILEEIRSIHESGTGAFCLESRPHPDFCGPAWWDDVDSVFDEAKKLGMRVWLFDDAHFPTGFANGHIRDRFPEKGKRYLVERHIDAHGPLKHAQFILNARPGGTSEAKPDIKAPLGDRLAAVVAMKTKGSEERRSVVMQNLGTCIVDGILYWDVPEGDWIIFIVTETGRGGGNPDYINIIDADSVRVLIDAVYEPHYARYKEEFGHVFAGFFSDEPGFGNTSGYSFDESIGRKHMPLPWSGELEERLAISHGDDFAVSLPALWHDIGEGTAKFRYDYMDCVTRLYAKNFSGQIGDWCRARNVEYIGHVIEDQNAHARLGCGAGHFFRAMSGQDMAGVDVVLQQIMPGFDKGEVDRAIGRWDGEFFHYALAKLGSSLGHIDPLKRGRTMCELYGAYGWMEGLKLMKWLTDHMIVRGVNWLVPHAFSPKTFPDSDCPPHFRAQGHNPQFRYFSLLMKYANRLCHLFNGGIHAGAVAVLYHADSEWAGGYMQSQKPARELARHQIDYDIIPSDVFVERGHFGVALDRGGFAVNGEAYKALIIPYCEFIPIGSARFIAEAVGYGFPVYFIDAYPRGICGAAPEAESGSLLEKMAMCRLATLSGLAENLSKAGLNDILIFDEFPALRCYHYRQKTSDIFMFFNEHPEMTVSTDVELSARGAAFSYDAFENRINSVPVESTARGVVFHLELTSYESRVLIVEGNGESMPKSEMTSVRPGTSPTTTVKRMILDRPWNLSLATAENYPDFTVSAQLLTLENITSHDRFPDFSGTMRYETEFAIGEIARRAVLTIEEAYETVEIQVNGEHGGIAICPPYRFDVGKFLKHGINRIRIDVTNTLVHQQKDFLSRGAAIEPSGIVGKVFLE